MLKRTLSLLPEVATGSERLTGFSVQGIRVKELIKTHLWARAGEEALSTESKGWWYK